MKSLIITILNFINRIIPKGNIIIFNSFPDIEGNALALYRYIVEEKPELLDRYRIVWCINSLDLGKAERQLGEIDGRDRHAVIKKLSFRGLLTYLRASKIISTHNYITGLHTAKGQIHYNLWHGMPFKSGGNRIQNPTDKDALEGDLTIVCSDYFKTIKSDTEGIPLEKIHVTGQPADDNVLRPNDALKRLGIEKEKYRKVLLWCPTYRKSDVGSLRADGATDSFGVAGVLSGDVQGVDEKLMEKEYLLLVKFHPMDVLRNRSFPDHHNIMIISQEKMREERVTVNELMGDSDVLITDYSSAFITYLLTGRPILYVVGDMEEYRGHRGFSMDDPDRLIAGEKITSEEEFRHYLDNMDEINTGWKEKYADVQKLAHKYLDGRSSERVCRLIFDK
jgi:CDP-glycerol glycerophosphotransferase (TagB/SpsB family)